MRRGYRIIHRYDKPLRPRPSSWNGLEVSSNTGARLVGCLAIVLVTSGFFWFYDTTVHHQRPAIPMRSQSPSARTAPSASTTAPLALVPDMNSPQVAFANADVELGKHQEPDKLDEATAKIPEAAKAEGRSPSKNQSRMVKRQPQPQQAPSNAEPGFRFFQSLFGQN